MKTRRFPSMAVAFALFAMPAPARAAAHECGPTKITISGVASSSDAKSYRLLPFEVPAGTTRIEVGYRWQDNPGPPSNPITQTVFDLGLWDTSYPDAAGFRGWSGSRQGKLHANQLPIVVQQSQAENNRDRGYVPGPIPDGTWYVDLGIAAVGPTGATWAVEVTCKTPTLGSPPVADPVDDGYIANRARGWYHGDFHMHGFHSNPGAADPLCVAGQTGCGRDGFVKQARDAKLDFLMVTDYVTGRHWDELGVVQRAATDLIIWPGREVITYFGHANVHGETRDVLEYRHGFHDVDHGGHVVDLHDDVQVPVKCRKRKPEALFQVNHPTIFPGPVFQNFCRGCEFQLGDDIDWGLVDTIEVVTGPTLANSTDISLPKLPGQIQNPFIQTAIDLWEDLLARGYRITAVKRLDSKGVDAVDDRWRVGYGSSATAVYAKRLSRRELSKAIRKGRVYVRTRGVDRSPELEFTVSTPGDQAGMFGDTITIGPAEVATLHATVRHGAGQILRYLVNGNPVLEVPVLSDPFDHELPVTRVLPEGSLGTFWRIETLDADSLTTIGNPIFLRGPEATGPIPGVCPAD